MGELVRNMEKDMAYQVQFCEYNWDGSLMTMQSKVKIVGEWLHWGP